MTPERAPASPSAWIMAQAKGWPEDGRLLDFACGRGRHSRALAPRFEVLAVDRDREALNSLAGQPRISTLACDLEADEDWPFAAQKFDVVVVTNYLFRPKLRQIFDLVAVGGYIAYETFGAGNAAFGRPKNPDFLLHEGELAAALPAHFSIIEQFHGTINTPHSAVIQRLAAQHA